MRKLALSVFLAGFIVPASAWCGSGSYTAGDPDSIQLSVNFEDHGTNIREWEPLFREASRLLFDATEKQVKITKVVFFLGCPELANRADVRIFNDLNGANATVGGLGRPGARIRLSQLHKTVNTVQPGNRGQFGLVHEMGHYVFGLLDEYLDKRENPSNAAFCIADMGDGSGSIMDGGTTVAPNNRRTEFCVTSNHRTGMTAQDKRRVIGAGFLEDKDGWSWIEAWARERFGVTLTPPERLPVSDPNGFGADPVFEVAACNLRVSVGIDSSGSMSGAPALRREDGALSSPANGAFREEAPIDAVKQGASKLVRLLEWDDVAGIVSAGEDVNVVPMREMSPDNKFRSLSAIRSIRAAGQGSWSQVLGESFRQIAGEEDTAGGSLPPENKVVVLVSDGGQVSAGNAEEVLSSLKQNGVVVHAIGVADGDVAGLRRVATETGGNFLYAKTVAEVDAQFLTTLAQINSRGIVQSQAGTLRAQGEPLSIQFSVDPSTAAAPVDFLLTWSEPGQGLQMAITGPGKGLIKEGDDRVVFQTDVDRRLKRYRALQLEPGVWTVKISNPGSSPQDFAFQVHSLADAVTVSAYGESDVLTYPAPLVIRAVVHTDNPVAGVVAQAWIESPNGERSRLDLFDDGATEHADDRASDGVYSNVFTGYREQGSYTVEVDVNAQNGFTVSPGEDGEAFTSEPVAPFVRKDRFSVVVVEGAQD